MTVTADIWTKDGGRHTHRFATQEEYNCFPKIALVVEGQPNPWIKPQETARKATSTQEPIPSATPKKGKRK